MPGINRTYRRAACLRILLSFGQIADRHLRHHNKSSASRRFRLQAGSYSKVGLAEMCPPAVVRSPLKHEPTADRRTDPRLFGSCKIANKGTGAAFIGNWANQTC